MRLPTFLLSLLSLLSLSTTTLAATKPKNAILLSSVKSLTLRANAKTSHRRVAAIPQLTCTGPACKHHTVEIMRCTNQGSDYSAEDIQWSCIASLPEEFKLGSTDVVCEGYANRDDEYVLKGSCGVEYRLLLTEKGEERYGNSFWGIGKGKSDSEGSTFASVLFMLVFVGVAAWILYAIYLAWNEPPNARRQPRRPGGGWGGGWGGGGGGPGDDPPPPYPGTKYYSSTQPGQQGFVPGFWTGAASGAAAGYMAGNRGNRQPDPVQRGSSWFGGGGGGSSRPAARASGSSSSSGTRHESTGFGSTSRR